MTAIDVPTRPEVIAQGSHDPEHTGPWRVGSHREPNRGLTFR